MKIKTRLPHIILCFTLLFSYLTPAAPIVARAAVPGLLFSTIHASSANGAATALGWQISTIDSTGDVGFTPSLALEPGTNRPYISYYDNTNHNLKLAFPVDGTGDCGPGNHWSCNSLAFQNTTDFGLYSSLDFNSQGKWGISYTNSTAGTNEFRGIPAPTGEELFYEAVEQPANILVLMNNLRYDQSDVAHITYGFVNVNQSESYIKHARYVGQFGNCGYGAWQCEQIVETSLVGFALYNTVDFYGNLPYIFYRDSSHHLAMATSVIGNCGSANNWSCQAVDTSATVNGLISARINSGDGMLGVAYVGGSSLRYANLVATGQGNCGGSYWDFTCITIEAVGTAPTGHFMAASLDSMNHQPVIAYTDNNEVSRAGNTVLKIAYPQKNGNCGPLDAASHYTWHCEVVDDGDGRNDVGFYPALQVGPNGMIHIAYYDAGTGNLKYAFAAGPGRVYLPITIR